MKIEQVQFFQKMHMYFLASSQTVTYGTSTTTILFTVPKTDIKDH